MLGKYRQTSELMLSWRCIRSDIFLATVGELNFTKVAEKCNVSQPSLARAIKQLEGEFGATCSRASDRKRG